MYRVTPTFGYRSNQSEVCPFCSEQAPRVSGVRCVQSDTGSMNMEFQCCEWKSCPLVVGQIKMGSQAVCRVLPCVKVRL